MAQTDNPGQGHIPDRSLSKELYLARDDIRSQLTEYMQQYMELEGVDLTKTSFLSYIVDIMSTLTANILFYQSSIYKEFFLTQAQLPGSVYNLSAFLGYTPSEATYSTTNLLMTVPLGFEEANTEFTIPDEFTFTSSDGINFLTYYQTDVTVTNNNSATVSMTRDGRVYNVPVIIDTTANMEFKFALPVRQYKINEQEFQIDEDLQIFQFTNIEVPISGQVSGMTVYVRGPNDSPSSSGQLYTEFSSLYLMSSTDYGYVVRKSVSGRTLYFGNGLIGIQPEAGSTVIVTIEETEGEDGNVISGSIQTGGRIYSEQGGVNTIVSYEVTNPSPSSGGSQEETMQDVRANAISSLTALNRLVSEDDYKNASVVVEDSPITNTSFPVLKRSDLKVNEIQLFVTMSFLDSLIPARNIYYSVPVGTTLIPRGTTITFQNIDYITIFDITVEPYNSSATYNYIIDEIQLTPILVQSWEHDQQDIYHFLANSVTIEKVGSTGVFEMTYFSEEVDFADCTCEMRIIENDTIYTMTTTPGVNGGTFSYTFADYLNIPTGELNITFTVSNPNLPFQQLISQYSVAATFSQDLSKFMLSNTVTDGTSVIVYDIPGIKESYYNGLSSDEKVSFELDVMQKMISSMDLIDYRMLTDFVNIKLCNTTGIIGNMQLNEVTKDDVLDVGVCSLPGSGSTGDRYLIGHPETGIEASHKDEIAVLNDSTAVTWIYSQPTTNDVIYVDSKDKKYFYSSTGWIYPQYEIPLKIEVEIIKTNDSSISEADIMRDVKDALLEAFDDRFGPNITLYRSEIIEIVQGVDGVLNCRLIKPETSIFFDFDIDDFTQEQLLQFAPEYIYFTESDITVRVITGD